MKSPGRPYGDASSSHRPDRPLPLPERQRRLARRSLYGAGLLLYPAGFHRRFGADLTDAFLDLLAAARVRGGNTGLLVAWAKGLTDLLTQAGKERLATMRTTVNNTRSAPPGGLHMWDELTQDLRLALRSLRNTPGYTAAAVITLALGIGANSAIFSVAHAALLQSAPVTEAESVVAVWTTCRAGAPRCSSSYPDYLDYRARSTTLSDLAAYAFERASLGDDDGARLIFVQASSGNYFDVLGVGTAIGRTFDDEDEQLRRAVVVLSHDLWRDQFAANPDVVGQTLRLNRAAFEIIGVTPEGFQGLHVGGGPDVFIPLLSGPLLASGFLENDTRFENRGSRWIGQLAGRMNEDVTVQQVRDEMASISTQLAAEDPDAGATRGITVESARHMLLPAGDEGGIAGFVFMLGGIVAFTLLLACANLANLLLARATGRRREICVRLAIGASKARLARQMLTESTLLALIGGGAGVAVGSWVISLLHGYQLPGGLAIDVIGAGMDARVLTFTLGLSVLTGLLFGMVPALQASRTNLDLALRGGGRGSTDGATRLRGGLVAVQLALCLVLVAGAGIFVQALWNGLDTDLGFDPEGVAVASLDLSLLHYSDQDGRVFVDTLIERLESMPGVVAAGVGTRAPFLRGGQAIMLESIGGYQADADEELRLEYAFVSDGYFGALGLPLIDGRPHGPADDDGRRMMIINRDMAERWWAARDAVGGRVNFFSDAPREASAGSTSFIPDAADIGEIVGVVENTKWDDGIAIDDYPFAYLPLAASEGGWLGGRIAVLVRGSGDAAALLPVLRAEISALEPDASLITIATMESLLDDVLMPQRMGAQLLMWFGALALLLAGVGIYSVVAYSVNQRRRDLGIRIALGADQRGILALVIGGIMGPVVLGLLAGVAIALSLGGTVAGFMYEVNPTDPWTLAAVGVGLVAVAILASLVPARRATMVEPTVALRVD